MLEPCWYRLFGARNKCIPALSEGLGMNGMLSEELLLASSSQQGVGVTTKRVSTGGPCRSNNSDQRKAHWGEGIGDPDWRVC
jgi:hypothetical protein